MSDSQINKSDTHYLLDGKWIERGISFRGKTRWLDMEGNEILYDDGDVRILKIKEDQSDG